MAPVERRVASAKLFSARLADSLRVTKPLSEILAHGRLHEVAAAIQELNADDFSRLPKGQRALVLLKCEDVVGSGEEGLRAAGISFLQSLLRIGIHLSKDDYKKLVAPAMDWAYERDYSGRQGNVALQVALERATGEAGVDAHTVLAEELLNFLKEQNLDDKPNWYLQGLRSLLTGLLANQVCDQNIEELSVVMRRVNGVQRAR